MTLAADTSPAVGRPTFLGLWRELADAGSGIGPLILSAVTAVAGLAVGVVVSGGVGFAAAAVLWAFIPALSPGKLRARSGLAVAAPPSKQQRRYRGGSGAEGDEDHGPLEGGQLPGSRARCAEDGDKGRDAEHDPHLPGHRHHS
jgi:hypothetical protein